MVLRLYRANHVERLLEELLHVLALPSGQPFQAEWVMVQNPGMSAWVGRKFADHFGICAGVEFLFPRRVIQRIFNLVLGEEAGSIHAFDPERMVWTILAELPNLAGLPSFSPLVRYLQDDPGDRKQVQLARRIADVFDQYALYRPEMVLDWEQGRDTADWQEVLWRAVSQQLGGGHIACLTRNLTLQLSQLSQVSGLPARICCFGISTLPPLYVHILQQLAQYTEIHFFLLQPTLEYFADIRSRSEINRALTYQPDEDADSLLLTEGHALLASMGRMGREFQQVLLDTTYYQDASLFRNPEGNHLLAVLQHDMLHLIQRGNDAQRSDPVVLQPTDHSLSVHACHGRMREVEVLRDQLLDLFAKDPSLSPGDVVVMMPQVDVYAPLIEACFGVRGSQRLPFSVADRTFRGASPVIDAFFRILDLVPARATASEVLDLLALAPVADQFDIGHDELETLGEWARKVGIRWGIDAEHRHTFGQPASHQNTWWFGLNRLLLGYALPDEQVLFHEVLPRDQVEGIEARLLGRFTHFCHCLFQALERLDEPLHIEQWQQLLLHLLDRLVYANGENEWQHAQIREALDKLVQEAADGGYTETMALTAVRALLEDRIEYENEGWNFMAEGITFCAMVPMRSIPFRVVAMIGLNDGDFPRSHRRETFDKMAKKPRVGDRSKRFEERYLFLEALLAARERVIITYVGQDLKDNAPLPPSVVVSELFDCLAESFILPGGELGDREALIQRLVVRHPMQGFNPDYFNPRVRPELFSYSETHYKGALGFVKPKAKPLPLFRAPLPAPDPVPQLALDELVRFFNKPVAYLMRKRLGFQFEDRELQRNDREPLDLHRLEKFQAGSELLGRSLRGLDPEFVRQLTRAEGSLPLGTPGEICFQNLEEELQPLIACVQKLTSSPRPPLDIKLELDGLWLVGRLASRYQSGMIAYEYKRTSGRHLLSAWIRHLALCCAAPDDQSLYSIWVGRGEQNTITQSLFRPAEQAAAYLEDLVKLYQLGQSEPLLLFPKTSYAFARAEDEEKGRSAANKVWSKGDFPESSEPHHLRVFGDLDVIRPGFSLFADPMAAGDFPSLSRRVFDPLLAHLQQEDAHALL